MNTRPQKLILFSTYHFCARRGLDWIDTIIKQTLLRLFGGEALRLSCAGLPRELAPLDYSSKLRDRH